MSEPLKPEQERPTGRATRGIRTVGTATVAMEEILPLSGFAQTEVDRCYYEDCWLIQGHEGLHAYHSALTPRRSDGPVLLDLYGGEGGAAMGYHRAGWRVVGVDTDPARLRRYPFECVEADAIKYLLKYGHLYDAVHASPTCWGYSRGTVALPDRLERYDRHIALVREILLELGLPYVIENVQGARSELRDPILLCGRMFKLEAIDDDGTHLVMDRHRLFESNVSLAQPEHEKHDRSLQVAGSYAGARRDKHEARHIRKGGYVPSVEVQRELLGTPWMTERGCQLSIPPVYTEYIGAQLSAIWHEHPIHNLVRRRFECC